MLFRSYPRILFRGSFDGQELEFALLTWDVPCSSFGRGLFRPAKTPEIAWEEISPNPKVTKLNPCFSGPYSWMANHYPSESYGKSDRPQ